MSFEMRINRARTSSHTINLYESDEATSVTLAATDVVRFKMYRRVGDTPILDLDSAAASAAGSSVTVDELGTSPVASVTVKVAQGDIDTEVDPGVYRAEVAVVDDSDSDLIKAFETGVVYVGGSGGGDIALA